jgi:hypothetical protein
LVSIEKVKIRQPYEAREEERMAIELVDGAVPPRVIQADIVNAPEILLSNWPVIKAEIR